jgi:predicted transcriptional regulator
MADRKLNQPETAEVEIDEKTLAAIDKGLKAAEEGRSVPLDEVRKMIPCWISEFESRNRR